MDLSGYNEDEVKTVLEEKATELFKLCDRDGNNYLTKDDLFELTRELGLTPDQVDDAFDKLDTDGNKFLTLDEFVEGFSIFLGVHTEQEADPELLEQLGRSKELFQLCDADGKGYVTEKDLLRLNSALGLNNEEISQIFYQLDDDHNGFLTLYEFSQGFSGFVKKSETLESDVGLINGSQPKVNGANNIEEHKEVLEYTTGITKNKNYTSVSSEVKDLLESVGSDLITDDLTEEQLQDLWKVLRRNDAEALSKFESFLTRMSGEMRKAKLEAAHLEHTLKRFTEEATKEKRKYFELKLNKRDVTHDLEVQRLYEEMENQIKTEKMKQEEKEAKKERALKDELAKDLEEKEDQLKTLLEQQEMLESKLGELQAVESRLKEERSSLTVENTRLEDQLNNSMNSLNDSKTYISQLQALTEEEKTERIRAAVQASNGMKQEHESLILQLDALRSMNHKLRDDKDAIEMSIKRNRFRQESIDEEIHRAAADGNGHRRLGREGSNLANYFGDDKRGRKYTHSLGSLASTPSQQNHHSDLNRRGSLMSSYFPPVCGSNEDILDSLRKVEEEVDGEFTPNSSMGRGRMLSEYGHAVIGSNNVFEHDGEIDAYEYSQLTKEQPLNASTPQHLSLYRDNHVDGDNLSQAEGSVNSSLGPPETPSRIYKVVFIGDSSVGKSSFIHRFCFDDFLPNFSATIGVDFQMKSVKVRHQWIALQLWDTAGQERFRSITKQYFRKADGVVIMFDLCSALSFTNVRAWLTNVEEGAEDDCSLMILGSKLDRADGETGELRRVQSFQAEALAKEYGCDYFETSAKDGSNINDAMLTFAGLLSKKEDHRMQASVLNLNSLSGEDSKKKKGCCGKG